MNAFIIFIWIILLCWSCQSQSSNHEYLTIIGTVDGNVHAINQNFQKVWSTSLGEPMIKSSMSMKLNKRYSNVIPSLDGSILFQNSRGIRRSPIKSRHVADRPPSLAKDGLIHVGTKSCKLYCFNLADGSLMVDPDNRESKSIRPHKVDTAPIEFTQAVPFWLGRLDYKIEGMDPASGEDEFSVVYSDLEPLRQSNSLNQMDNDRNSFPNLASPSNNKAILLSTNSLTFEEPMGSLQSDIISSPEGYIQFVDMEGAFLNEDPLHLGSPAMNAFMLVIINGKIAQLIKRINVRYGLNNMNSLHKLKTNKPHQHVGINEGSAVDDRMVLIQASSTESGKEFYYGLELVNSPNQQSLIQASHDLEVASSAASRDISFGTRQLPSPKASLKSPLQTIPVGGRSLKSIRQSEPFLVTKLTNNSASPLSSPRTKVQYRQQVNSIIGFHKISELDEDLWFDELFHDKSGKSRPRPELRTVKKSFITKFHTVIVEKSGIFGIFFIVFVLCSLLLYMFSADSALSLRLSSIWTNTKINSPTETNLCVVTESSKTVASSSTRIGSLIVEDEVIGYGSHGTVVYKGYLNGRAVAVKRMLAQFNHLADREISMLIKSDGHPNVVRYFVKEERIDFVYLGLQLCQCSLKDLILTIKKGSPQSTCPTVVSDDVRITLLQLAEGLSYLHKNRIVHRDIKPHNILCSKVEDDINVRSSCSTLNDIGNYTLKISDMGLSKQLDDDHSFSTLSLPSAARNKSDNQHEPIGTIGWQAPEMILRKRSIHMLSDDNMGEFIAVDRISRKTLAVDVFSLGCVFFFILTSGMHPFGDWYEREVNIVNNNFSLDILKHIPDACDLINDMLQPNPSKRISSNEVCNHHFFWTASKRLEYLTGFSDRLEQKSADSSIVVLLQSKAGEVFSMRWDREIDEALLEDSGRFRKYDPYSVLDLLRLIRNKKNHYHELGSATKEMFGSFPDGFLRYFESKFPKLLQICIATESLVVSQRTENVDIEAECQSSSIVSPQIIDSQTETVSIGSCVVWQDSALYNKFKCRGWWRDSTEWTNILTYSSSSKASKKPRSIHHVRAIADKKYRTRLCSHWEHSNGESCPMRKKGKCDFAHGPLELRLQRNFL